MKKSKKTQKLQKKREINEEFNLGMRSQPYLDLDALVYLKVPRSVAHSCENNSKKSHRKLFKSSMRFCKPLILKIETAYALQRLASLILYQSKKRSS